LYHIIHYFLFKFLHYIIIKVDISTDISKFNHPILSHKELHKKEKKIKMN